MTTQDTPGALREQASHGWVWLDGGALSPAELAQFDAWLATSPAHREAFDELTALWGELDALKGRFAREDEAGHDGFLSGRETAADRRSSEAVTGGGDAPRSTARGIAPATALSSRKVRAPRSRLPRAAGLGVAAGLLFALVSPWQLPADYRTTIGEMRTVRLEDGSAVHLSSDTALDVDMTPMARRLNVRQGEAWFEVAKDPARPFLVQAGRGTATALGTVYDVRHVGGEVRVTVIESRVAVRLPGADGHPAAVTTVAAGQQTTYGDDGGLGPALPADINAVSAWRRSRLVFENLALGEVVAELNRYHRGIIAITDAGIRERPVSGVFRTDAPLEVVAALESALDLKATRLTNYLLLLHR